VRGAVQQHLVAARADVQAEGDRVAHRPGGQEQRRLEPQQLRNAAAAIAARIACVGRVWVSE